MSIGPPNRRHVLVASLLIGVLTSSGRTVAADATQLPSPALLLGEAYPIEMSTAYHPALLHWLDSLTALRGAGLTAGKTTDAHRLDYVKQFGELTPEDRQRLVRFAESRVASTQTNRDDDPDAVMRLFFESPSLEATAKPMGELVDAATSSAILDTARYFAPRYRQIWEQGSWVESFASAARTDSRRPELTAFLQRLTQFYDVELTPPHPVLHLMPVRSGFGSHAQALGRHLLIELRPGDGFAEAIAPIVHENAHFLFDRLPVGRQRRLQWYCRQRGERGMEAWALLREALPTAIAQGVADQRFHRRGWSRNHRWYHLDAIDQYAKQIFPFVKKTLNGPGKLDEAFLGQLLDTYERGLKSRSP